MNSTENQQFNPSSAYYDQQQQQEEDEHDLERSTSKPLSRNNLSLSSSPQAAFWKNALINASFIASWYLFATLISLYNKWMFSPDHYNFQYPLFVSACHMYIQFGLAALTLALFPSIRSRTRPTPQDYMKKALPCGMASGLDIGLSNTSLKTVTLSFYTMCKSSSLAFVLLFAFIFKLEKPTYKLTGIILLITAGVVLMVSSETQFDFWGMVEVLSASCLGGLRWSLTQILLDKQSMGMNTPIATIFWLAPTMGLSLSFCSLIFEGWNNLLSEQAFFGDLAKSFMTMTYIATAGVLAYLMTVSEYFLIQRTSVVTLSIAGVFKEVGTIFLSTIIFHDVMTPLNISGLGITLFGIALYNVLKYKQSLKKTNLSDGRDRQGLIVLTSRTNEDSKRYAKLDDEDDEEDVDVNRDSQEEQHHHHHHASHPNNDNEDLDRDDSLDNNIDPHRRLMLMTEKATSLQ
ncbi:hypothetical protein PTTG_27863 [Puccinia triticina 1-1 BBBD Race 1]|uniref:TPT domain-containing protein n=2 Tax=Puccinia triticina TaxID=208348 RepID=A0A180GGL0_PUCT1|nr:uncharacterized protein PtA15_7A803 [Puccinia triticina]OAV91830.1 hypothetical protein PTTG_27863 [Puccinia triticina 1-1 BBBD Race 1]WAQ87073.1 hypothetical protein PtA15_7A803 [Puccinia triticina]WAR56930.1 hypothetical protein PtB15_7B783 [Puccinia triticina]